MKFCYVDESGYGGDPLLVLVGLVVDYSRMHLIKETMAETLKILENRTGQSIKEFHAAKFYRGQGIWRGIDGNSRAEIVTDLLNLIKERRHDVVVTAALQASFDPEAEAEHADLGSLWCAAAFHLILTLQRCHQVQKKNKGHTVFIFDREVIEEKRIQELIAAPPEWSDEYYDRGKRQGALDQVVDVPYFGNSDQVLLIQLADLMAYLVRRYVETAEGVTAPTYADEPARLDGWMAQIRDSLVPAAHAFKRTGRNRAQDVFWELAPKAVRELGR